MTRAAMRTLARRKCSAAIEGAISHGDMWTYTGEGGAILTESEEVLLCEELKRVVLQLRNQTPPRRRP